MSIVLVGVVDVDVALTGIVDAGVTLAGVVDGFIPVAHGAYSLDFSKKRNSMYLGAL